MANISYKFHIGIDVSKTKLDVALTQDESVMQFTNDLTGINNLMKSLSSKKKQSLIVLEASGGYEKFVSNLLKKNNFNVAVVNAKRVRDFAKAGGKLAKTDCIDAHVIRQFGQTFNPTPQACISKEEEQRTELLIRRRQMVRNIALEKQQAEHASEEIKKRIEKHIRFLEDELDWISNKLEVLFNKDAALKAKLEKLDKIKGVGEITAMDILIDMPELGTLSPKEASALAGVAPYNRDSGQYKGKREIGGGRASVRSALYMAILTAKRFNPQIKKFYDRLIEKGKLKKVAMVACMRKLIIIMNAIIRDNTEWDVTRA